MIKKKVESYLEYCEYRKELDGKTLKAYRIDLRQYFEYFSEKEPDKEGIEKYITALHKTYKQKTIKRKIASVKAFYNYLEEEEYIKENPFRKIRVKFKEAIVLPRIIPRNEIEQLLNHMYAIRKKGNKQWLRDVAVIETFFATGARVYEISNIKVECIDLNSGLIRFKGKGNKERYIQISDTQVLEVLKMYYRENSDRIKQSGYFFINRNGLRFSE